MIYRDIPYSRISIVKDLWEKNRSYHENLSEDFGYIYTNIVFEERITHLDMFDNDQIKITVAENLSTKEIVGYCISTIKENEGETQSLHVEENKRGLGIGKNLMYSHLEWMKNKGCTNIIITVAFENKNTIGFYKTLGFKENTIEMRLK